MRRVLAASLVATWMAACGGTATTDTGGGLPDVPAADLATDDVGDADTSRDLFVPPSDPGPGDLSGDPAPTDAPPDAPADLPSDPGAPDLPADPGPTDVPDDLAPDPGPLTVARCLADQAPPWGVLPIDYDQFHPVMGSHCKGTNHQDITGIQRVVFVGDSVTTGTPPTLTGDWYRNRLAKALAQKFGLEPPGFLWQNLNLTDGIVLQRDSGDFSCCAKFGARTDDLTDAPHRQMVTCNPESERGKRTLIVMTMGGNDIFDWAKDLVNGAPIADLWAQAVKAIGDLEESIHWAVDDPATFPGGVFVVFATTFEHSDVDSASDLAKCPGSGIIDMNTALIDPAFAELSRWFTEEYVRIAVETGTDLVLMGEAFCGHGHMRDDPLGRCYRGPGAELWFDITCMHPGAPGHAAIADLFLTVISE